MLKGSYVLQPDVDIAILGGGCAGLSVAVRLAAAGRDLCVIEPRESYSEDRAWSFWRTAPDPFQDCVVASWAQWSVAGPRGTIKRASPQLRYETVGAKPFYVRAQSLLEDSATASLNLGTSASTICKAAAGWQIETNSGTLTANHIIDTRPPARIPTYGQFFLGWEIQTERPVFEPNCVKLMHFRQPRSLGVDFVYTLPFTRTRALVEVTCFAPASPGHDVLRNWLETEIAELNPGGFEVLRSEAGALPMQDGYSEPGQNGVIRLGLGGAAARPSTGYAFARIQTQANHVVAAFQHGVPPQTSLDSGVTQFLDRVFLRVLQAIPHRGPALFESLFRNTPPDRLERFLSGSTRPADRLSVMAALPPLPFLKAALVPQ